MISIHSIYSLATGVVDGIVVTAGSLVVLLLAG
jgi:hypothetical protein